MNQKFTKQEQQKFLRGLEQVNLDSDSELQDSFYQKERKRVQLQISSLKTKQDWSILQQLKRNVQHQDEMMTEYEIDRKELHQITSNQAKNVIDNSIIEAIKQKVATQINQSILSLADQQYNQSVLANQSVAPSQQLSNASFVKVKNTEKKIKAEELAILKKIEIANQQRQHFAMQQEDHSSLKYEHYLLSQLFKNRFIRPSFPKLLLKDASIQLKQTKLVGSFVRLAPQPINQNTVLPKNAPEIALKHLKQIKRKPLRPSSKSQIKLALQKIQSTQQKFQDLAANKKQCQKKRNEVDTVFQIYLLNIKKVLPNIERIASEYRPRFLRYLGQQQKNLNYEFQQTTNKQRSIDQIASLQNSNCLCELKLIFQKLTNLRGIENFKNLQEVQLQFNLLSTVDSIEICKRLIELNLSHNKIKNIKAVNSLPWLRLLNVENNSLQNVKIQCKSLEVLLASRNRLQEVNLEGTNQLRILKINYNRLHALPELTLLGLEQLQVSHNQISEVKGIGSLVLLKKLDFSFNRVTILKDFVYLYLNSLNLANNSISTIDQIFLPCLQYLQLDNNKLEGRGKGTAFLPNLKMLNIDDNRLEGFGCVWWLLRYSKEIEILRYGNNEYFLSLREKIREVYQSLIYKTFSNLKILNDSPFDSGIAQYYRQNYAIYSNGCSFVQTQTPLTKIQTLIRLFLRQSTFGRSLQQRSDLFVKQKAYIDYQWKYKVAGLKHLINLTESKQNYLIVPPSLFYFYDFYQSSRRNLCQLLRGLLLKRLFRKQKRSRHFLKLKPRIAHLLAVLLEQYLQSQRSKAIAKFKVLTKGMNQAQAAIKIQKVWRGYIRRKLYKKLINKRRRQQEDSDLEDVDIDFFNNELEKVELDLDFEGFEDVIIRPEVFELLQAKQRDEASRKNKGKEVKKQPDQKQPLTNNFLESRTKLKQPKQQAQNESQKLMKQWHLKDPKVLKALQFKQQKREQMKKKQLQKNMTAAERYQRFKKGGY